MFANLFEAIGAFSLIFIALKVIFQLLHTRILPSRHVFPVKTASTHRHVALITGGSYGIGYHLARSLARRNYDLILLSRTESTLKKRCEELEVEFGVHARYLAVDLSKSDCIAVISNYLYTNHIQVHFLVCNAGGMISGWTPGPYYSCWTDEELVAMRQLNGDTTYALSRMLIPSMLESGVPCGIMTIGSLSYLYFAFMNLVLSMCVDSHLISSHMPWKKPNLPISLMVYPWSFEIQI